MGSIAIQGNELLFINIFILSLWYQDKSTVLSSATHRALPQIQSGERSALTTRFPLPTVLYTIYSAKLKKGCIVKCANDHHVLQSYQDKYVCL